MQGAIYFRKHLRKWCSEYGGKHPGMELSDTPTRSIDKAYLTWKWNKE
jgi:hypothetical protein